MCNDIIIFPFIISFEMEKIPSASLNILQPSNLLVFMVFYSPVIIAISIIAFSVIVQGAGYGQITWDTAVEEIEI